MPIFWLDLGEGGGRILEAMQWSGVTLLPVIEKTAIGTFFDAEFASKHAVESPGGVLHLRLPACVRGGVFAGEAPVGVGDLLHQHLSCDTLKHSDAGGQGVQDVLCTRI